MFGTIASLPWMVFMWFEAIILQILYRLLPLQRRAPEKDESVSGKVVVITGANSGLGRYVAKEMAKRGATVVMAVRNTSEKESVRDEIIQESGCSPKSFALVELDLGSLASIRACGATLLATYPVIDILVNNGGISLNTSKRGYTSDGFEQHMGVNHLGHYLLTRLLLPALRKSRFGSGPGSGARVVTVSSTGLMQANLSINDFFCERSWRGVGYTMHYGNSKLANCLFAKELARREGEGGGRLKSFGICPGFVKDTAILRNYQGRRLAESFMALIGVDLEKGCEMIMYCALSKEAAAYSGKLFRFGRRFWTGEALLGDKLAKDVWTHSEQLVGLSNEE